MFKDCYHLCTTALKDRLLCHDEEDYIAAWNALAVCSLMTEIRIYCLCLMSNHIHILLSGTSEKISGFFRVFKQKLGMYLKERHGSCLSYELEYELFPVTDRRAFCQEVAYILRNPYKAGISGPFSYKWSSGCLYFNPYWDDGKMKSEFSVKDLRQMLRTRFALPESTRIIGRMISPGSFIDAAFVEKMFDHSSVSFFNLAKTWAIEDTVNASHGQNVPDAYSDEEVVQGINKVCKELFLVSSPSQLGAKDLARLVRQIRSRFGCPRSQLLRLLPVDDYLLDRVL